MCTLPQGRPLRQTRPSEHAVVSVRGLVLSCRAEHAGCSQHGGPADQRYLHGSAARIISLRICTGVGAQGCQHHCRNNMQILHRAPHSPLARCCSLGCHTVQHSAVAASQAAASFITSVTWCRCRLRRPPHRGAPAVRLQHAGARGLHVEFQHWRWLGDMPAPAWPLPGQQRLQRRCWQPPDWLAAAQASPLAQPLACSP